MDIFIFESSVNIKNKVSSQVKGINQIKFIIKIVILPRKVVNGS